MRIQYCWRTDRRRRIRRKGGGEEGGEDTKKSGGGLGQTGRPRIVWRP